MFICGESYVILLFSKVFKVKKSNRLLTPDPCLTQVFIFCFIKLLGTQFLRVAKGFRFSFDELWRSNGAGGFSVVDIDSSFRCGDLV